MNLEAAIILSGGVATLAIFSFVLKENPFFRIFEHLFIGIAAGWGIILTIKNFLWPVILTPMLGLDRVQYPDGTWSQAYRASTLLYLIPLAFGLLYYFLYSNRYAWLAKLVIGLSLGASAGLAFQGFFNQMLPQLKGSFKPLLVFDGDRFDWGSSLSNCIFVSTLLCVMYYFFFTFRHGSKVSAGIIGAGRYMMMLCFGAYFGSTVMARMALLVERLQFLITQWYPTLLAVVTHAR